MSGYTPGPWEFNPSIPLLNQWGAGTDLYCATVAVGEQAICVVAHDGLEDEEAIDNARLIAAAPELLEALFALLPHVEHADNCGDMDAYNNADVPTCGCGLDSARERASAAISRATGEGE